MKRLPPYSQQGDILIVDDEMANLRVLSRLLGDCGYHVRSAREGTTALMIVDADPPDLILLDIKMPGMDGIEVCQQLKKNPGTADVPIIFVSGLDDVADQVRGFAAGGVDYITKPFQLKDVEARVQTHLQLHQLQKELEQRNEALHDRVRELQAINHIAHIIATTANLQEALANAAAVVTELFDNRLSLIMVRDEDNQELQVIAAHERVTGPVSPITQVLPLPDMPVSREALDSGQSAIVTDLASLDLAPAVRDLVETFDLHMGMVSPLMVGRKSIGTLSICQDNPERRFSETDISLVETIAAGIAGAIENARLTEQSRIAAVDAERQRLARELHDSVTQSLYSVILLSSGWQSMAEQGTLADPAASFQQLGEVGLGALREMRLLIHQLRPPILEEVGLVQALQQRLDAVELRANVESRLLTHGDVDEIPQNLEDQLFYIAQEALNNSLKHAFAEEVIVRVENINDCINLSVEDDGQGFDPNAETAGFGLKSIQERADGLHGKLSITSGPGQGTVVKVSVPCPA